MRQLSFPGALALVFLSAAVVTTGACASEAGQASGGAPVKSGRRAAVRSACREDYQRFCGGIRPGNGELAACFKDHVADLAPGCHQALADAGLIEGKPASSSGK